MPRQVRSIEIYLPLEYNDGSPIEEVKFVRVQRELLRRFGGVTSTVNGRPSSSSISSHLNKVELRG